MSPIPTLSAAKRRRAFSSSPLASSMIALFWATLLLVGVMGASEMAHNDVSAMQGPPSADIESPDLDSN
jgi:hypothetical protein